MDRPRRTPPLDDLLQGADHPRGGQREADLGTQPLAVAIVNHVEQAYATPVGKLIVHEVHGPDPIDGLWHRQGLGFFAPQSLSRLDAKVQFQCPVDPIHPLVVPAEALDVT